MFVWCSVKNAFYVLNTLSLLIGNSYVSTCFLLHQLFFDWEPLKDFHDVLWRFSILSWLRWFGTELPQIIFGIRHHTIISPFPSQTCSLWLVMLIQVDLLGLFLIHLLSRRIDKVVCWFVGILDYHSHHNRL